MSKRALRAALIIAVVLAVFFGIAYQRSQSTVAVSKPASVPAITFTGAYADDWQANCGPLVGALQTDCIAKLDAHYGRISGAPVPPAPQKGR